MSPKELLAHLQKFDPVEATAQYIAAQPKALLDIVQQQLHNSGEDAQGHELKAYKDKKYAAMKHAMNPLPGMGVPDLYLSGALYRNMQVKDTGTGYEIVSTVPYFPALLKAQGLAALQLQADSKQVFRRKSLYPALRKVLSALIRN